MTFLSRKLLPLYTKLKTIAVSHIHKFLALSDKDKKKILIITALVALSNFAYSLFSLYTLVSFGVAFLSIAAYFKINLDAVRAKGLITYMPHKMQKALLQRSLFDIICDIWFIPRISIYIKAFILPLFIKIDPSEAIHQLEDLSIGARKLILTKGILNIMPNTVKTAMLPGHQPATADSDSSDESPEPEDQRDLVAEKNETSKSMNRVDSKKSFAEILFNNDSSHSNSHKTGSLILDSINNDSNIHHKAGGQNSTDEEGLVNHNISLSKQMELKKSLPSFADMNPLRTHLDYYGRPKTIQHFKHQKGKPVTKGRWSSLKDEEPLSLILNSSRLEKGKGGKPELSETWDRLEIFARKHREKQLRQKHMGKPKKIETQGVFQAVQNIATLLSKDAIMERLEEVNLFKVFLLSSLALLLHFSVSKKTKYWFYYALQIMMYVTGITLSTGSMALYIVKVRTRYRQWKEEQEKEKEKEKQRSQESLEREDSE